MRLVTASERHLIELLDAGANFSSAAKMLGTTPQQTEDLYRSMLREAGADEIRARRRRLAFTGSRDRVVDLLLEGYTNPGIARVVACTPEEVAAELRSVYRILRARNRLGAVVALRKRDAPRGKDPSQKISMSA